MERHSLYSGGTSLQIFERDGVSSTCAFIVLGGFRTKAGAQLGGCFIIPSRRSWEPYPRECERKGQGRWGRCSGRSFRVWWLGKNGRGKGHPQIILRIVGIYIINMANLIEKSRRLGLCSPQRHLSVKSHVSVKGEFVQLFPSLRSGPWGIVSLRPQDVLAWPSRCIQNTGIPRPCGWNCSGFGHYLALAWVTAVVSWSFPLNSCLDPPRLALNTAVRLFLKTQLKSRHCSLKTF